MQKNHPVLLFLTVLFSVLPAGTGVCLAVDFDTSDLPIVVISTDGQAIPDESEITADMGIIFNGEDAVNSLTDAFNEYDGKISIKTGGGSVQAKYPKKQYELETRSTAGDPLNVPLLGMPAGSGWVLDAPYGDKSLLRNVLAYKLAGDMGWYAGRTQFCELLVNGQYMGIYVFTEKISPDQNRLNIESLTTDDDDLTGGYIIRIDELTGDIAGGWYSDFPADNGEQIYYQYHYPSQAAITSEQKAYIQSYVFQFENAMKGTDLTDPETGYPGFINTDSFADFVILNEMGKNVNGYRLNSFMYKDSELGSGELTMGPVWGFGLSFGNADFYDGASAEGWQIDFSCAECPDDENQLPFWWKALFEDPDFKNALRYRWKFLRESILDTENMNAFIDETAGRLEQARSRNFEQWPVLGKYVWPNPFIGETYEDETDYLKQWIADRCEWIDGQWGITPGGYERR